MKTNKINLLLFILGSSVLFIGCHPVGPEFDRPFPLGQVTDAHWETQQTNAEAAKFILYEHEFVGDTSTLNPAGRAHMTQIALRLPQTPFPVVIEETEKTNLPEENIRLRGIDEQRRANVASWLLKFYANDPTVDKDSLSGRVIIAPSYAEGITAEEASSAYESIRQNSGMGGSGYGGRMGMGGMGGLGGMR